MGYKIVVMSCDKNEDLWLPFHLCMEKYWKNHPEIIYYTETKTNPYYKTINKNVPLSNFTGRIIETIKDIENKHILLLVDDIFIRDYVDNNFIRHLCSYVTGNVASLNFEKSFDQLDRTIMNDILIRNSNGKYKLSLMCQLWRKKALLRLCKKPRDPWRFEKDNDTLDYSYLITRNGNFIKWGRENGDWKFGIVQGKWARECKDFFDKEGIIIDYSIRGFYD